MAMQLPSWLKVRRDQRTKRVVQLQRAQLAPPPAYHNRLGETSPIHSGGKLVEIEVERSPASDRQQSKVGTRLSTLTSLVVTVQLP